MSHADFSPTANGQLPEARPHGDSSKSSTSRVADDDIEPIAIVGFSARLPQDSESANGFWKMICEGRSAASAIPKARFNADAFYHPDVDRIDTMNIKTVNFLKGDIAAFDAPFFAIQPSEVDSMDPQQRCMLEVTYRAFENAGISLESVAGSKTCVFVGNSARDYEALLLRDPESPAKYIGTGIGTSMLANRVSWFYDLRGPSVALDTACSSSLSALHLACQSLRSHESHMGLVGGCNLILAPDVSIIPLTNMGFFSPDGKCFSFDHRANGYAKGEGAGVVVIKLLVDALKDGDTIRAVIRATGANQDGKTPGLTQPSKKAQEDNIRETYRKGGLDLNVTKYFESHGTGTQVGDPIEAGAINAAFQRTQDNPLYIGAVKPNIGHLEAASSIAGLIKCVMILEKGLIPPNINFEKPNDNIPAEEWHIKFPLKPMLFPSNGLRRISINSFGYGGSNTHAVLDDSFNYMKSRGIIGKHNTVTLPPSHESLSESLEDVKSTSSHGIKLTNQHDSDHQTPRLKILVFSASDEDGLRRLATAYQSHFLTLQDFQKNDPNGYMANLSYTLSNKRSILPWKSFVLAHSVEELQQDLFTKISKPLRSSTSPAVSFIFTGQGAQWSGMGRELLVYPVFRASLSRSQLILQTLGCEWNVIGKFQTKEDDFDIDNPRVAQPLCTALQIAIVDLLTSWQIFPKTVTGHSSGEIAAAYCAGSLSHESAISVAFHRGSLAACLKEQGSDQGAMTSIGLSESAIEPFISEVNNGSNHGRVEIGCVNGPGNVTLTGDRRAVDAINALMERKGIFARRLKVDVAYHSTLMMDVANKYLTLIQDIVPRGTSSSSEESAKTPAISSTVTGRILSAEHLSQPKYWVTNLISKVKFLDAIQNVALYLLEHRATGMSRKDILIEIGPTSALQRPVKDTLDLVAQSEDISYDSILKRDVSGLESCLGLIGRLWTSGFDVDLAPINYPTARSSEPQLLIDLPEYPFNHTSSYWTESRISKNFRMRKHARHDLLGVTSADWNPLEPRWRNIIRVKENPWILEHAIQGLKLYPAAGMIIMAIEGARQLTDPKRVISGYRIEDISINRALMVTSAAQGLESQLYFRSRRSTSAVSRADEFILYAYSNEEWASICEGTVTVEFEEASGEMGDTLNYQQLSLTQRFEAGVKNCKEVVNSKQFYRNLASYGFDFGPTFQSLEHIRYNDMGEATATIRLDGWKEKVSDILSSDHVIHPTALDGMLHLTMAALSKGGWESIPTYVPTQAKSLWVSNNLLTRTTKSEVEVYTMKTFHGYREAEFWIAATNADKKLMVVVDSWRMTPLGNLDSSRSKKSGLQCYYIEWKPDLTLMEPTQIALYCKATVDSKDLLPTALVDRWELVCLLFMSSTIKISQQYKALAPYLQKYLEWTNFRFSQSRLDYLLLKEADGTTLEINDSSRENLLTDFAKSCPEGALHVAVGQNMNKVLDGEVDSLDLLFSSSLVQNFYHSPSFGVSYRRIAAYVDLLAHKNPNLNILEIGAGTGAATGSILRSLSSDYEKDGVPRFSQYTYTDISPAFFQDAKERFQIFSNRMTFSMLDIERDPLDQGFKAEQYDLIICGLVLHATAELSTALQNTRKMLKPAGKLVLFEPSNPQATRVSFVFGLLPGWWLGTEKKRKWGPLLSDSDWHETLLENGFSGAEIHLPDHRDERHTFSVIISTALNVDKEIIPRRRTVVVTGPDSPKQSDLSGRITSILGSTMTLSIELCSLEELHSKDLKDTFCIFLLEIEVPFLTHMNDDHFIALKTMTSFTDGVLWVTQGCGESASRPEFGLVTGFGRNMGSEDMNRPFVELALETNTSIAQSADYIVRVFYESLVSKRAPKETEYMQKDGLLCLSRVVKASSLTQSIAKKTVQQECEIQPFGADLHRALELSIRSPGQLDTLQFKDDEYASVPVASHDIEINVQAAGLEFKDVEIALGQLPGSTLGSECAGIVTRVGESVQNFQIGDRVCCCTLNGAFKTRVRAKATDTAKIPKELSYCEAAALPVAFCVAYYSVIHWGHLQEGESILIHSGAEAIGQMAIQLARICKANIFTTVDTEERKRRLIDAYGLQEDHVFLSGRRSFASILNWTTGGMDVVLDSLSGEGLEDSLFCAKPFGRFINLRKPKLQSHAVLSAQNVSFISTDLCLIMEKGNAIMEAMMKALEDLLTTKSIATPQPVRMYKVSEIEQAFQNTQMNHGMGKTIVEMLDSAAVPVLPSMKPSYSFDPNATYVISGGLGGLGRSIVRWMADRQAKHFVLLSRSGAKNKVAFELIEEMRLRGVEIATPPCDITEEESLLAVLEDIKQNMPPIRGCIQASMVLKDGIFENMSLEDFNAAVKPKVQGSWNLHNHLPQDMDFYVLLSSITGVTGSRGQRNYACGNTYQNALARHRVSQGQKCISLDLGSILSIGFAAEKDLSAALEKDGFQGIRKAEFFALLDYCCDPSLPLPTTPLNSQIVTGLGGIENMTADRLQEVYWTRKPLFSILRQQIHSNKPANSNDSISSAIDYEHLIRTAASQPAAEVVVVQALREKLAAGLSIPVADIDVEKAIYSFGIDSLVALELRNWFIKEMKADVTIFDIMQSQSVRTLGAFAAGKSDFR